MLRRFGTLFIRKNEHDADLRYRLANFCMRGVVNGEFTESRLQHYRNINEFVVLNRRSRIRTSTGLRSIFYARFYTSFNLMRVAAALDGHNWRKDAQQLVTFFDAKAIYPNEKFKDVVDSELQAAIERSEAEISKSHIYDDIITRVFNNSDMANTFLRLEKHLLDTVEHAKYEPPYWRDKFNAYNRATLAYAERHIGEDIRCLTKTPQRVKNTADVNRVVLGLIATGVVPLLIALWIKA